MFDQQSMWISTPVFDRTPIVLENPDIPTNSDSKSIPNLEHNKYIEFGPSDVRLDAAQTTVPFIDTQKVEPHSPVPLIGLGIYFKGNPGYGGFIAPKVIPYDYSYHIKSNV